MKNSNALNWWATHRIGEIEELLGQTKEEEEEISSFGLAKEAAEMAMKLGRAMGFTNQRDVKHF